MVVGVGGDWVDYFRLGVKSTTTAPGNRLVVVCIIVASKRLFWTAPSAAICRSTCVGGPSEINIAVLHMFESMYVRGLHPLLRRPMADCPSI